VSIGDIVGYACLCLIVLQVSVWPCLIFWKLHSIARRLDRFEWEWVNGPDPDDGEPIEDEPSNVIAIGRRAA
jgi:hypothetical protein